MSKKVFYGKESRKELKKGIDLVANAVKVTAGGGGRNVLINVPGNYYPHITKDGVTVSRSIMAKDNVQQMGVALIQQVAQKTVDEAGDGTTCSTILAQAIIEEGFKSLDKGYNPIELKKGIDFAVSKVINHLENLSRPISGEEEIFHIANVSANGDKEIGEVVATAMNQVGVDGVINVEDSYTNETHLQTVDGFQIDRPYRSPFFITDGATASCVLEDPYILMHEKAISNAKELESIFRLIIENGIQKRPLLIISDEVDGEALATLVTNKVQGRLKVCVVTCPSRGQLRADIMSDIATSVGGIYITRETGITLRSLKLEHLGSAEKVVAYKDRTVIIGGRGDKDKIHERALDIKNQINEAPNENIKNSLKERLARLKNGVVIVKVGGSTETEIKEKRDRIDDAICATRAALQEGYVAGGGTAFLHCISSLNYVMCANQSQREGVNIIKQVLKYPFKAIMENAGLVHVQNRLFRFLQKDVVLNEKIDYVLARPYGHGYNVKTADFVNMLSEGIIDPTKVMRVSLQNAASVSSIFLTTEATVSDEV